MMSYKQRLNWGYQGFVKLRNVRFCSKNAKFRQDINNKFKNSTIQFGNYNNILFLEKTLENWVKCCHYKNDT